MKMNFWYIMAAGMAVALLGGCGGDDGSSADVSTFEGTIAGSGLQSGKLSVTVHGTIAAETLAGAASASDSVAAEGTLTLVGGAVVALSGTFNPSTGALDLAGSGYAFAGSIIAGDLNGTYTAPGAGSGIFTGADSSAGAVAVFCGTYSGTRSVVPHQVRGVFNMVIAPDGSISGVGSDDMGRGSHFTGTLNGYSFSGVTSSGTTIAGSLNGNTVSGTFHDAQSSGTWSGTRV
jgi:hypothetical protein